MIELVKGDITKQPDLKAIVNAANAELRTGGGVAGAIHAAAGKELERACRPLAPIETGEAVITDAFNLPNRYVIHCLGPVYGRDKPEDTLLASCYSNALKLAEEKKITSIGFPAISTGVFGYPTEEAAAVALKTLLKEQKSLSSLQTIRLVLFDEESLKIHERAYRKLT